MIYLTAALAYMALCLELCIWMGAAIGDDAQGAGDE